MALTPQPPQQQQPFYALLKAFDLSKNCSHFIGAQNPRPLQQQQPFYALLKPLDLPNNYSYFIGAQIPRAPNNFSHFMAGWNPSILPTTTVIYAGLKTLDLSKNACCVYNAWPTNVRYFLWRSHWCKFIFSVWRSDLGYTNTVWPV